MPMTITRLLDGTINISVRGDIDLDNAYMVREAIDRALADRRARAIVVDLSHVDMIDSVGIGTLVSCFHTAAASGVRLRLTHPSTIVYRQLWVAGLVGLFGLPTPSADGGRQTAASR
jgi:anti-anti-sigma factor